MGEGRERGEKGEVGGKGMRAYRAGEFGLEVDSCCRRRRRRRRGRCRRPGRVCHCWEGGKAES